MSSFLANNFIHIISSDVPYPPDYGGIIDVFYKIVHLHTVGFKITLHCYDDGRGKSEILEKYCEKIFYYPRHKGLKGISLFYPVITYSRKGNALLNNLLQDDAPILFEGLHTTWWFHHPRLKNRIKVIRNQNVEQEYYQLLSERPGLSFIQKIYYKREIGFLQKMENNLQDARAFLTVSMHDHDFFKKKYPQRKHLYLPSFQPYNEVESKLGTGDYCLYQGNLGHIENKEAVHFLLDYICPALKNIPFIFAGRNPTIDIQDKIALNNNCTLIANPDQAQMQLLIEDAQINLLPTFQGSGLKLKLLNALFKGRHVIVNKPMLLGTGLEKLCLCAHQAIDFITLIEENMLVPFTEQAITDRKSILLQHYNNHANAMEIKQLFASLHP